RRGPDAPHPDHDRRREAGGAGRRPAGGRPARPDRVARRRAPVATARDDPRPAASATRSRPRRAHTRMNTFRRYIQNRISHSSESVTAPWSSGAYSGPSTSNVAPPRCRLTILWISGLMNDVLMQYAAIELVPITTSGKTHRRHPPRSTTA